MTLLEVKFRIRKVQAETRWGVTLLAEGKRGGSQEIGWYPLDTFEEYRELYGIWHDNLPLDSHRKEDHFIEKDRNKAISQGASAYADYLARHLIEEAEQNSRKSTTLEITI